MKDFKKATNNKGIVAKIARSVSFSSERLSDKKQVSKDRERYIKKVSTKALLDISA
jgi:hypothetical protein